MVGFLNSINKINEVYGENLKVKKTAKVEKTKKSDEVAFSSNGPLIQKAMQSLNEMPEIREDRVAALKDSIAKGSYNINGEEVVRKISESIDIVG